MRKILYVITIAAFVLNVVGVLLVVFNSPLYLIMSPSKRAYLSGLEPDDPLIKAAFRRDLRSLLGLAIFLAGIFLHFMSGSAQEPLYFRIVFISN